MNIQEYSKKFVTILIALKSSITLWGQKNDICTSKKLEKNYGIQPIYGENLESPSVRVRRFQCMTFFLNFILNSSKIHLYRIQGTFIRFGTVTKRVHFWFLLGLGILNMVLVLSFSFRIVQFQENKNDPESDQIVSTFGFSLVWGF